ncbi:MAG: hypothetical protein SGJ18_06770 [Pseudomonadota bacterium]|nr:hypothetical protein [Pseudomonadota bacterium]
MKLNNTTSSALRLFKMFLMYLGVTFLLIMLANEVDAKTSLRTVKCDESKMIEVYVKPSFSTIVNFPIKPDNVVLGGKNQFAIEYIKNDIALTALASNSRTNLFVYLFGRRCGFQLMASSLKHDNLILVRDPEEAKIKVPLK